MDPKLTDGSDLISYRTLERSDFKAQEPPAEFAAFADRVGAATCAYVRLGDNARTLARSVPASTGGTTYEVTPDRVEFVATMNRDCSWWNPRDLGLPPEYILQHEQIHFAIIELEARRLTASFAAVQEDMGTTSSSPEAGRAIVNGRLQDYLRRELVAILARSRDFDEDTSMGHAPEQQQQWWLRVRSELSATDAP